MAITEKQRAARAEGLGASDIPTILGLNPWGNVHDLYLAKTGRLEPQTDDNASEAAEIGTHMESTIRTLAEKRLGVRLVKPTATFKATNGIMLANVDFMVGKAQRGSPIVEAKTTGQIGDWHGDTVPDRVLVQVAAQMICTESQAAQVAALFGRFGFSFRLFPIERDADMNRLCSIVEEEACNWWRTHVEKDIPPASAPTMDVARLIRREAGKSIQIDRSLVIEWQAAKTAKDAAEKREESAKAAMLAAMGDASIGIADTLGEVHVKPVTSRRIDADKLRSAYPDAARECTKTSESVRVTWHPCQEASNG